MCGARVSSSERTFRGNFQCEISRSSIMEDKTERSKEDSMTATNAAYVPDNSDQGSYVKTTTTTSLQIESSGTSILNSDMTEDDGEGASIPTKLQRLRILLTKRKGLFFAVLSAFLFSSEDVLMEIVAETMDVFQVTFMVSTLTITFSGTCLFLGKINPPNGKWQWISLAITGTVLALGMPTALLSLKYMDVGSSIAVIYTMPIFTGIFGWIILKEPLKLIHVLFVTISLAGVILIAQPEFIFGSNEDEDNPDENLLLGTIFALTAAVTFALLAVVSRKQTSSGMHLFVLMFYNAIVTASLNALICTGLQAWKMPSLANWFEILGFATIDFGAQITLITALILEAAILVSIATTSEVVFAFIWQISIFRVYPDWKTGVGAFLIVSTCVGIAFNSSEADEPNEAENKGIDTPNEICHEREAESNVPRNVDETPPL